MERSMSSPNDALSSAAFHRDLHDRIERNWWTILVVGAITTVTLATVIAFANAPFHIHEDSALFQHAGWYIGQGATLYVDIWDLKPPLIYGVTTVLAFASFGNMAVLHVLGVLSAVGAVVGGIVFVGLITHRLTADGFASVAAPASMLVLASVYTFPYAGIRPKYFAFLCATAALFLAVEDRHFASGVAAALAAGFWQLGGGVALLVVGMALHRSGPRAALRAIAGGVTVASLTVLPFVLTGTAVPLFVEVVLASLYGVERYTVPGRLLTLVVELGPGLLLVPIAAVGWLRGLRDEWREYWWVGAGGSLYLFQVFLELQGAIELVLLFVFLALGVGLLVAAIPTPSRRSILAGCVVVLVLTTLYWSQGPITPVKDEVAELQAEYDIPTYAYLPPDPPDSPSMQTIYWEKLQPENCHYRLGDKQKYFEWATGGTIDKSQCGQWPFEQPPLPWLAGQL